MQTMRCVYREICECSQIQTIRRAIGHTIYLETLIKLNYLLVNSMMIYGENQCLLIFKSQESLAFYGDTVIQRIIWYLMQMLTVRLCLYECSKHRSVKQREKSFRKLKAAPSLEKAPKAQDTFESSLLSFFELQLP